MYFSPHLQLDHSFLSEFKNDFPDQTQLVEELEKVSDLGGFKSSTIYEVMSSQKFQIAFSNAEFFLLFSILNENFLLNTIKVLNKYFHIKGFASHYLY